LALPLSRFTLKIKMAISNIFEHSTPKKKKIFKRKKERERESEKKISLFCTFCIKPLNDLKFTRCFIASQSLPYLFGN
jgi:hypothetical protein